MNSLVNSITADELADTPSSVVFRRRRAAIHLRRTLPHASSNLPRYSGEQPSNASCLVLLRVGFTLSAPSCGWSTAFAVLWAIDLCDRGGSNFRSEPLGRASAVRS